MVSYYADSPYTLIHTCILRNEPDNAQTFFEQTVEQRVVGYRQRQGQMPFEPPSCEEWLNARATIDSLHNQVLGLKGIIGVAQGFAMKAQDAIGQLLKEKNELLSFSLKAVRAYNQSAEGHRNQSIAYDALVKAAIGNQGMECDSCVALMAELNQQRSINEEQATDNWDTAFNR